MITRWMCRCFRKAGWVVLLPDKFCKFLRLYSEIFYDVAPEMLFTYWKAFGIKEGFILCQHSEEEDEV